MKNKNKFKLRSTAASTVAIEARKLETDSDGLGLARHAKSINHIAGFTITICTDDVVIFANNPFYVN